MRFFQSMKWTGPFVGMACALSLQLWAAPASATASAWPHKPIKLVVCFPPGNAADTLARDIAPLLSESLKQPVIVENKAGAGGIIGIEAIAKSPNDHHTFGVCSLSPITILPAVREKMPYDVKAELAPVVITSKGPMVFLVNKHAPFNTLEEFVQYAQKHPAKLSYASLGTGTISQMSMEAFKAAADVNVVEVGYKGSSQALTDLIAGHVDVMLDNAASSSTHIKSGSVKALAVTTKQRIQLLPDVPTMAESKIQGLKDFDFFGWVAFFASSKTPPDIIQTINTVVQEKLQTEQLKNRAIMTGQEIFEANTPADFAQFIDYDFQRWSTIAKQLGIYQKQ